MIQSFLSLQSLCVSALHLKMGAVIDRSTTLELTRHFAALGKHVPLRPIRSADDYEAAVSALNALLDAGAADENHPLADLAATLGELIWIFVQGQPRPRIAS
jgi:hypothetical protein